MNNEDNNLITKNLIEQTFTNWVNPELEKRKTEGKIDKKFKLKAVQIIFSVGGPTIIRLNREVKAIIEAKINKKIKKGEQILDKDVKNVRSIKLLDEENDFGHITILRLSKGWFVGFNFIYDVSKSEEFHKIAVEFMKSSYNDLKEKRYRPFIESLSVAAENLAKARIYLLPDKEIRQAKKHGTIQSRTNIHARAGSVIKTDQKDAFNKIIKLRDEARYDPKFNLTQQDADSLFKTMRELSGEVFTYLTRFGKMMR